LPVQGERGFCKILLNKEEKGWEIRSRVKKRENVSREGGGASVYLSGKRKKGLPLKTEDLHVAASRGEWSEGEGRHCFICRRGKKGRRKTEDA